MQLIGLQLWTPVKWDVLKKSNLRQTELDQGSSLHHPNVCIFTTKVKTNVWLMNTAMMLMQARLNLPEISTFSFRTNTTDTPLNPHYPKIFEKKTPNRNRWNSESSFNIRIYMYMYMPKRALGYKRNVYILL